MQFLKLKFDPPSQILTKAFTCSNYITIQWQIQDFPLEGADHRCGHFLAETYVKTKEFGLIGGGGAATHGSANAIFKPQTNKNATHTYHYLG